MVQVRNARGRTRERPCPCSGVDRPGVLPLDAMPQVAHPACWYRFVAPPGLKRMTLTAHGQGGSLGRRRGDEGGCRRNGRPRRGAILGDTGRRPFAAMRSWRFGLNRDVAISAGSAVPEPVGLDCGIGTIALGDWSKGSGPGMLQRRCLVPEDDHAHSGPSQRPRHSRPWPGRSDGRGPHQRPIGRHPRRPTVGRLDITEFVKPGENRIEILVYNTLANHYRARSPPGTAAIPSRA